MSVPQPGARRGGGTLPAPSFSSRLTRQLHPARLGSGTGTPGACLAMSLSSSPQAGGAGELSWLRTGRGKHRKGPNLSWKEKRGCPIPTPALLPRTPAGGQPCAPAGPTPQLAGAFDCRCGRGGGVSGDTAVPAHLPRLLRPRRAPRDPRSPALQSQRRAAAKLPPWAPPGPTGWQRCYFT